MKIIIRDGKNSDQVVLDQLIKFAKEGVQNFFLPAGGTPERVYELLLKEKPSEFSSASLWQVDDILNGKKSHFFLSFFEKNLGPYFKNLRSVFDSFYNIDQDYVSYLGLGVNGHVAFHEPHIPEDFSFGCVQLGDKTLGYLDLPKDTWGISYGVKFFLQSKSIILHVKGKHKNEILRRFLEDDPSVPAHHLKRNKQLILVVDSEAWGNLEMEDYL